MTVGTSNGQVTAFVVSSRRRKTRLKIAPTDTTSASNRNRDALRFGLIAKVRRIRSTVGIHRDLIQYRLCVAVSGAIPSCGWRSWTLQSRRHPSRRQSEDTNIRKSLAVGRSVPRHCKAHIVDGAYEAEPPAQNDRDVAKREFNPGISGRERAT